MSQNIATPPQVRVLVVDDSAFMRTALSRMIASESGFEVVATACSGSDALEKISSFDPDVVTLDIEMPGLDGLETLRYIMNKFPRPVIMVSAVTEQDAEQTFNALAAGAFDYVPKHLPSASLDIHHIRQDLIAKIRAAAQSRNSPPPDVFSRKPPQSTLLGNWDTLSTAPGGGEPHGDPIEPGVVYTAPVGMHMPVARPSDSRAIICLDTHPEDCLHTPSVRSEEHTSELQSPCNLASRL